MRFEVTRYIFSVVLKYEPEVVEFIVKKLVTVLYLPEDEIIRQGEVGTNFFVLAKGDCDVFIKDPNKKERLVRLLRPGSLFGEVALITKSNRTATVKSRNYCTAGALSSDKFTELR